MRLGEILIERKLLEPEDLERALELQKERGDKLGKILIDLGFIAAKDLLSALSEQLGVPLVAVDQPPPAAPEIDGLSPRFMRQCRFIPLRFEDSTLTIAMADPLDFETISAVRGFSGLKVATALAPEQEILDAIDKYYGEAEKQPLDAEVESAQAGEDLEHLRDMASEAPVIRLVNAMIAQAVEKRASDIHIEPFEKEFRIRYRVDGVLFNQEQPPREMKAAIVSRLKLMAKLNIAERRLPQDGRIKIKTLGREVDLRVSTLPTLYGESVVMRLLDRSAGDFYDLRRLGFDDAFPRAHGALHLAAPRHFPGHRAHRQRQIHHALLGAQAHQPARQEDHHHRRPGRIPDGRHQPDPRQSADRADVRGRPAAHRAPGPGRHHGRRNPRPRNGRHRHPRRAHRPPRLLHAAHQRRAQRHHAPHRHGRRELPDHLVAGGGAGAAPGARDLPHCKIEAGTRIAPDGEKVEAFRGAGCENCSRTGYTSRVGIFELMELNEEIRKLIMANGDASEITAAARRNGMRKPARRRLDEGARRSHDGG